MSRTGSDRRSRRRGRSWPWSRSCSIRRRRYIDALTGRGWTFDSRPQLAEVLDHQAPPFGLGFVRSVDEGITGTTRSGVPFRVFEYAYREGGPPFDQRVASLALPLALPGPVRIERGAAVRRTVRRPWIWAPGFAVQTHDADYRPNPAVGARWSEPSPASRRPATAWTSASTAPTSWRSGRPRTRTPWRPTSRRWPPSSRPSTRPRWPRTPNRSSPARFGFYGHPDWELVGSDDRLIDKYDLTTAGYAHVTEKVVRGDNGGLPVEAFIHRWKTQHTETSTDSQGKTTTRTVTEEHSEVVAAVGLPFELPLLSVNGPRAGKKVRFESEEFNDAFTVRTDDPKFASDVIHPRTMEYLMRTQPPGFAINGSLMRFEVSEHDSHHGRDLRGLRARLPEPGAVLRVAGPADRLPRRSATFPARRTIMITDRIHVIVDLPSGDRRRGHGLLGHRPRLGRG